MCNVEIDSLNNALDSRIQNDCLNDGHRIDFFLYESSAEVRKPSI